MKKFRVQLNSLTPLMFNPFRGQEEIPPERKLNLARDGETLILPASNIMGFLSSKMVGRSCINTFVPPKERPDRVAEVLASVIVSPVEIPITENGKPIKFTGWNERIYVDERAAQASKTARIIARRPVISTPWEVEFEIWLNETKFLDEDRLHRWFVEGGVMVGLGAFRPFFGRFEVTTWESIT